MTETKTLWIDDFVAAGYRPYNNSMLDHNEKSVSVDERMYRGSAQKAITDEDGTRYYIGVNFYDFTKAVNDGTNHRSFQAEVEFSIIDERKKTVTVSGITTNDITDIEEFFADLWSKMSWGYYAFVDSAVTQGS